MTRHRRLTGKAAWAACVGFLLCACEQGYDSAEESSLAGDPTDDGKADAIDPTRQETPNPLDWVTISNDEFDNLVAGRLGHPEFLPDDHPAARRMQYWADELDWILRDLYPERMQVIPRARIRLWVNSAPNGFISPASTCLSVPVRFASAEPDAETESDQIIGMNSTGRVFPVRRSACIDNTTNAVDPNDVAENLQRNLDGCSVAVEDGEVLFGTDCLLTRAIRSQRAAGVALTSTANVVVLTTGLLEFVDTEQQAVSVLVHELGHYLFSHASLWTPKYNYFYRRRSELTAHRPLPDPTLASLGEELIRATRKAMTYPVAEQRFHSGLFPIIMRGGAELISRACEGATCSASCDSFLELAEQADEVFARFPSKPLEFGLEPEYHRYETEAVECLDRITVSGDSETGAGLVALADALAVFHNADVVPGESLRAVAQKVSDSMYDGDTAVNALLEYALAENLGYYTFEQEADDFAANWLPSMGILPEVLIEKLFHIAQLYQNLEYNVEYDYGYERCLELYNNSPSWTDDEGGHIFVPIGNFSNPHHGRCFRIYNIDRQIGLHGYTLGADRVSNAPGGTFTDLQALITQLHLDRFPNDPGDAPDPVEGSGFVP